MVPHNVQKLDDICKYGEFSKLAQMDLPRTIIDYVTHLKKSPLDVALTHGNADIARTLWENGARWAPEETDLVNPFVHLVSEAVRELPENRPKNARRQTGQPARELLRDVLEKGDFTREKLYTHTENAPLTHVAMRYDDIEVFEWLVRKGGFTGEERNQYGRTVLEGILFFAGTDSVDEVMPEGRRKFYRRAHDIIREGHAARAADSALSTRCRRVKPGVL